VNTSWPQFGIFGIFFLIIVGGWIVTIVGLVDAIRVPSDSMYRAGTKLIWVLVILLVNAFGVGAIIYFVVGRPAMNATPGLPPAPPPPPPPGPP
jgi:hypothetical protein